MSGEARGVKKRTWLGRFLHWLFCHTGLNGGTVDYDDQGVYWKCSTCGRVVR